MRRWVLGSLLAAAAIPLAHAKGAPDLIVVSGGGLDQPVEISGPPSLLAFDPWIGQFADWAQKSLADAPCFRRSVEVMFFKKWPERRSSELDRGDLKMIYATRYCSDGVRGYVYLPGPGEPLYRNNASTIIRSGADGKWHLAAPAWDSLLADAAAMRDEEAVPARIVISGGELRRPVEISDRELLEEFNPWTGIFVDWEAPARMGPCNWEYEITYFKQGVPRKPQEHDEGHDQGEFTMIYGLRYCMGDRGEPGYVHLAGRTDKFWDENVHAVWDGTQAGEWHPSTAVWKKFIKREVDEEVHRASSSLP